MGTITRAVGGTLLASGSRTLRSLLILAALPVFGAGCDAALGEWKWFNGGVVTFQQKNVLLYNGKPSGSWECTNATRGALTLRWTAGFVDTITVTGDRMAGKNQKGVVVSATRRTGKPAAGH